ncbi:3'-5' exonuclease [Caldiplasma sukawensis]
MNLDEKLEQLRKILDGRKKVIAIDIETIVNGKFLEDDQIIAISVTNFEEESKVFISEGDSEFAIISELSSFMDSYDPEVIIGYNHIAYDIPLIQKKLINIRFSEQPWPLRYYLGVSFCLDMMYVSALYHYKLTGDYEIRSLKKIMDYEEYENLPLMRKKDIVEMENMSKGEAIRYLWKNEREKFYDYCVGDTYDLIKIYKKIFRIS